MMDAGDTLALRESRRDGNPVILRTPENGRAVNRIRMSHFSSWFSLGD